jgi:hypothetical protein
MCTVGSKALKVKCTVLGMLEVHMVGSVLELHACT